MARKLWFGFLWVLFSGIHTFIAIQATVSASKYEHEVGESLTPPGPPVAEVIAAIITFPLLPVEWLLEILLGISLRKSGIAFAMVWLLITALWGWLLAWLFVRLIRPKAQRALPISDGRTL